MKGRTKTHGMSGTREYKIWGAMIQRCKNPRCKDYKNYGGRGIRVCRKWLTFMGFWEDMGPTYDNKLTIERTNSNHGYTKKNCRWATKTEQQKNKRNNRNSVFIEHAGEKLTVSQWARKLGIDRRRIFCRLDLGWEQERAITTPLGAEGRPPKHSSKEKQHDQLG